MNRRATIVSGVILILLGLLFLAGQFFPGLVGFLEWPYSVIGVGLIFLLAAILSGRGGLAIPGMIISGIGGILYLQNATNTWASWSYMWALIPGFVGLGTILSGLINGHFRSSLGSGFSLIMISLVLFFIFGGSFGLDPQIVRYWPLLLIAFGLMLILKLIFPRKQS